MAGLQYYFFPTDFLYPRPQSQEATQSSAVPSQIQTRDVAAAAADDRNRKQFSTSLVLYSNNNKNIGNNPISATLKKKKKVIDA